MNKLLRKLLWGLGFSISVAGMSLILTATGMVVLGIGRNPPLTGLIGLGILAAGSQLLRTTTKACPRCGSTEIRNDKCQICDHKLTGEH